MDEPPLSQRISDALEMLPHSFYYFLTVGISHLVLEFFQRKVDDIVVVNFIGRDLVAEFKPDAMEEIDFFGRQMRRMGAEIRHMLLAGRKIDLQA